MAAAGRFLVLLPVVLALVSFILTSLTLFAGHKQGFMEEYAVIRINTSHIGHNLFDKRDDDDDDSKNGQPALLTDLQGWINDKKGDIEGTIRGKLNEGAGRLADKVVGKLHLAQWYSMHIMDACEGTFEPNFTSPDAKLKTTKCTTSDPTHRLNLTYLVDSQLDLGPLNLSLSDISWPDSVQDKIDGLNDALTGLFVVYVLAMGCSGLSMLASLSAFFLPDLSILTLLNLVIGSIGGMACLIGSVIVTATASKAVKHINDRGARFGISASRGIKFYTVGWIATGFMFTVAAYWLGQFFIVRHAKAAAKLSEKQQMQEA
ncbi:hypothetical protein CP532_4013 [Ophiocordyceps camponoti-leonardi (nom. inval.)]|nr:hypothetical protein CP532_4013 [Ophiocordyceps camponoti-leonardi (nom. inval.)]